MWEVIAQPHGVTRRKISLLKCCTVVYNKTWVRTEQIQAAHMCGHVRGLTLVDRLLNTWRTKRWHFRLITTIVWAARAAQPLTTHWKLSHGITNKAQLGLCSRVGRRTAIWNGDPFTRCSLSELHTHSDPTGLARSGPKPTSPRSTTKRTLRHCGHVHNTVTGTVVVRHPALY